MADLKNLIAYWRGSLYDADLMGIEMDGPEAIHLPIAEIETGQINGESVRLLFKRNALSKRKDQIDDESEREKKNDNDEPVGVVIAPFIARPTYQHGFVRGRRRAKTIWPLLIPATLYKDGRLEPDEDGLMPWIPRTLLETTTADLVIGEFAIFR